MRETVVFLPGMMADARAFGPQLADLSRDFAVMCIPPTRGERIEEIASGMLDLLPKRCALVGHGMGGMVALEIIRRAPDRVSRLALMDTSPLADTPAQAAERDPRMVRARTGRLREVLEQELPAETLAPGPYRNDILALARDMGAVLGLEIYLRQARALQRRRDQQGTLRKIAVPVLVLCGAQDRLFEVKRHAFMADLIPGATLQVIEEAGHLPALEAPEAVADALRAWLALPLMLR
ncbi:alpha/beta fold hydrolase [Primorskyibacter sp. 2E107]|uniref:alpha/beta fold hydrolase n=1 Tax=Primorskyibacter sp. 2E107 TaxID=3403458 RepID=UPI003AF829B7